MALLNEYKLFFEVMGGLFAVLAVVWALLKLHYRYREKFVFITNCHLLPLTFWREVVPRLGISEHGDNDHAFRPIVFLPPRYRDYLRLPKKGGEATLESCVDNEKLSISCRVYWIPEDMPGWSQLEYPMLSLIIRRFMQIERPLFPDDSDAPPGWVLVSHPVAQLAPLHRRDPGDPGHLIWACSERYSFRFRNPRLARYTDNRDEEAIIEYCGLSLKLQRKSIFQLA